MKKQIVPTPRQRANGTWEVRVRLVRGGPQTSFYGPTAQAVVDAAVEAIHNAKLGVMPTPRELTLNAWLDDWLKQIEVRDRTRVNYESVLRCHIRPTLGPRRLVDLAQADIRKLKNDLLDKGLAPKTVVDILNVLKSALSMAERDGFVGRNVAKLVDMPRRPHVELVPPSIDEVIRLVDVVEGTRNAALYKLTIALGLRRSEVTGLRWSDIDLDGATLHVRHQLPRTAPYRLIEPKSMSSRRVLALPVELVDTLRAHRAQQLRERLAAGSRWTDLDLVFCSKRGTPLWPTDLDREWHAVRDQAGLDTTRFHDLRHAAASLMLAQGAGMKVIQTVLGHSRLAETDRYAHLSPELHRETADRMGAFLRSAQRGVSR